jgi:2-polyprenyl-3-methyl-5-hydroxy-6-metoxy-1,4-benzoquinol methylase
MMTIRRGVSVPDDAGDVELQQFRAETRRIWEAKATFWDARFGEGNAFHKLLIEPAMDRLLALRPDEHILEVGCGNGAYARHLASRGVRVVATDLAETFLERARERTLEHTDRIAYRVLDATDPKALAELDGGRFDAVVSTMVLMDMPVLGPLFAALGRLLRPGGRFVFAVMHPCFNTTGAAMVVEEDWNEEGAIDTRYAMKVTRYLGLRPAKGMGMIGEPEPHYYFHRPLHVLLGEAFRAGLVLDGLEEPAFPPSNDETRSRSLAWQNYTEIPPAFVARLRPGGT